MCRYLYLLLHVVFFLNLCGCSGETKTPAGTGSVETNNSLKKQIKPDSKDHKKGIDPDDPSVVYDEPFTMNTGFKIYNGNAYDKASLWINPNTKLVIPNKATKVVRSDETNVVIIYIEKRFDHGSHGSRPSWPITTHRPNMGCAVKFEKRALLIGTFGEESYKEGSESMRLVMHVPDKVEIIRKLGLIGGEEGAQRSPALINPAPDDPMPALTRKKEGRPECWLAPTAEDGWHKIPVVPDRTRRAATK